eukprot:4695648-Amphidinium_carterae.1
MVFSNGELWGFHSTCCLVCLRNRIRRTLPFVDTSGSCSASLAGDMDWFVLAVRVLITTIQNETSIPKGMSLADHGFFKIIDVSYHHRAHARPSNHEETYFAASCSKGPLAREVREPPDS